MKVDELIKKLEELRSEVGNADVEMVTYDDSVGLTVTKNFDIYAGFDVDECPYISIQRMVYNEPINIIADKRLKI